MRYLGNTGILVSELCLGTATFGGLGRTKRTVEIGQKEADYIVSMALDAGINLFNTAERYSDGLAEEILGKALGARRKNAIVTTKVNPMRMPGPNDGGLSRNHIIEGCDASLKRLGTDYIDLYEIHEFEPDTPLEVTLRAMDDLVRAGKVRYIGCSNFTGWQMMKGLAISSENGWERFMTLEVMYSLMARQVEYELVPLCLDQGVGILVWSPLHGGLLSGKYRRGRPYPSGARFDTAAGDAIWQIEPEKLFNTAEELERIAGEHNATVSQAALNYLLRKPGVNSLIVGMRKAEQLEENIKAVDWLMSPEEVARLDSLSEPLRAYPYHKFEPMKDTGVGPSPAN
jgi:aryl-alcohol dehydrogenase-like predicted oxidoreductase